MASEYLLGDEKRPLPVPKGFRNNQQFEYFHKKKIKFQQKCIQKMVQIGQNRVNVIYE